LLNPAPDLEPGFRATIKKIQLIKEGAEKLYSSHLESSLKHEFFSFFLCLDPDQWAQFNSDAIRIRNTKKALVRKRGEGMSGWWVGKGPR
jgi:hypothetical protein